MSVCPVSSVHLNDHSTCFSRYIESMFNILAFMYRILPYRTFQLLQASDMSFLSALKLMASDMSRLENQCHNVHESVRKDTMLVPH